MRNRHQDFAAMIPPRRRRGAFMVLAFFCLIATLGFVAFSVDTGNIALNKTIMQNAVDSAALAAAMEIASAVENAPPTATDPTAYAREQAKLKAVHVADLNGVYINANIDVEFGLRSYNDQTGQFEIQWGIQPANAVKIIARKDNDDSSAPDAKLPMMFAGVLGDEKVRMRSEAIAYIESRDIAVVLDFSGSMRYDSLLSWDSVNKLGVNAIRDNLRQMYWELELTDGQLGTLDHSNPDDPSSPIDAEAKWLVVHGNPSSPGDPQIDVTFMYDDVLVESDQAFNKIQLKYGSDWYTISNLNTTSGTYTGSGSYTGDNIDAVRVYVDTSAGGPVVKSGGMGSHHAPTATVSVNSGNNAVTVGVDSNSVHKIKVYYTNGSSDTWHPLSGSQEVVYGDHWKTISDVKLWTNNGYSKKFYDFDGPSNNQYSETFTDDNAAVMQYFALNGVSYPYPSGSWSSYINNVRTSSDINRGGYREKYGGVTFMHYILQNKPYHSQTPALAKTSHFPFQAVRSGNELFVDFLSNLGFGDHVGLVSYDQYRRTEAVLDEDGQLIDLTADPLNNDYASIKTIMRYKQASHYYARTNMGGGIRQARSMITNYGRNGARPTMLLMTDGNANVYENTAGMNNLQNGFSDDGYYSMPPGFDWSTLEYPDGTSFYIADDGSYTARSRIFCLSQAYKAVQEGVTVHTLAVGAGADRGLMKAIAWLGGGEFISVEGDLSVADLMDEVEAGFYRIAALVPPARLADPAAATP